MDSLLDTLISAGLSPTEAEIYLILVQQGEQTPGQIQQYTELSRTSIHDSLLQLVAADFVLYRKEGRNAYYTPVHPGQLHKLIEQKKRDVALLEGEFAAAIKSLVGSYNLGMHKPGIQFYEGREELKEIYLSTLESKEPIYAILSPLAVDSELRTWLDGSYTKKRVAAGIEAKVIVASDSSDPYHKIDTEALRETVLIPGNDFPVNIEINIFDKTKVAFISYSPEEMVGFVIESPAIYQSMKAFYHLAMLGVKTRAAATPPLPTAPADPASEV